ncbi:MAG: penicillin-insensitive murein endopeptidase [Polyangiaceae bacterium]
MSQSLRFGSGTAMILLLLACQSRSTGGTHVASASDHLPARSDVGADVDFGAARNETGDPELAAAASDGATIYDADGEELDEGDGENDPSDAAHGQGEASLEHGRAHRASVSGTSTSHPLDAFTEADLKRKLEEAPRSLGSVSLGRPNGGALFNAVPMPEDSAWTLVDPRHAFGTEETVGALSFALRAVFQRFPGTAPVPIGHLSAKDGGYLRPHRSHQSGRDVDLGFYFREGAKSWYARATPETLDLERTVFLLRILLDETDIEMVLIDQSLHEPLRNYAETHGVDQAQVNALFRPHGGLPPIVRHAPGHATHLHLRFRNPVAQRSGARLASLLASKRLVAVPPKMLVHVARSGDTLAKLAARFHTTMHAIRVQNQMSSTALVAGRTYRIPVTGHDRDASTKSTASASVRGTAKK